MVFNSYRICTILLILVSTLAISLVSQGAERTEKFSISQPDFGPGGADPEVSWNMELLDKGIQCSLEVSFEKPKDVSTPAGQSGWEYRVEIDGMTVLQDFHTDDQIKVEQIIPLENISDGKHVAKIIVRDFEGKLHTQIRQIELNSAPIISSTPSDNEIEVFDPQITFSFMGERDGFVGMVDFYLDEHLLKTINISGKQNNTPINLSELTGSQIYSADLTPGKHLLTITTHGLNGSTSVHTLSIAGSLLLPEIKVHRSDDNKLESLEITFPASSKEIVGSAEVHFNRSTILAVRTDQVTLSISRTDLIDAFMKNNLNIGDTPATMIISARSANQVENWQNIIFK